MQICNKKVGLKNIALVFAFAFHATSTEAEPFYQSAGSLRHLCRADRSSPIGQQNRMMLMGYMQGIIDAVHTATGAGALTSNFCVPPKLNNAKLILAVCGYLFSHTDVTDDLDGAGVAGTAIGEAFPCPK